MSRLLFNSVELNWWSTM